MIALPQPEVVSAPGLAAVYIPPSWEGEVPAVIRQRLCVLVREMFEPIVAVFPPESSDRAGEPSPQDKVMLLLEPILVGGRAASVPAHECCDPHLFNLANTIRCGFRVGRPPTPAYLQTLAPVIAGHLQRHYAFGRGIAAKRLLRVVAYVDENLDGQIGVEEMSSVACLSTHHFSRMFRRSMGMTPHDFVTQRRIARARELLATTELPLQDIAGRVGYQTQAHFTRAFGEATGTTPMRYRRDQRGERTAKPH
ncbi:MAG TPA: AraC family transcriptional regulator [Usitatibacter sp.]|nr:AraC family transcriptional regulator [Usitatibacter sp.]